MKSKFVKLMFSNLLIFSPVFLLISCTRTVVPENETNQEVVAKIKKAFENKEFKTSHKNFYPEWEEGDEVSNKQLGIEPIVTKHTIKFQYWISKKYLDIGRIFAWVQVTYKEYHEKFIIEVYGFKRTEEQKNETDINQVIELLQNLKTNKTNTLPTHVINLNNKEIDEDELGIEKLKDKELNGVEINLINKETDDNNGIIALDVKLKKGESEKTTKIIIGNFLTNDKLFNQIEKYVNKFDISNPFNVNEKVKAKDTWGVLLNLFVNEFNEEFGATIGQMVEWKIIDADKSMWGKTDLNKIILQGVEFIFRNKSSDFVKESKRESINFINIKLNQAEKQIYEIKDEFENILKGKEGKKRSLYFENKNVNELLLELKGKEWTSEELEKKLGFEFPQEIKKKAKIKGRVEKTSNKPNDSDIVIINIIIEVGELKVEIENDMWIHFKKDD